jgi:hormone-sensitive lipase
LSPSLFTYCPLLLACLLQPSLHYLLSPFPLSPGVAASSFFTSGKYAIDPELRGAEFERITQNLDVHFWKAFWNITETEILSVSH